MTPWEVLDSADVPGGGTLRLKRRGAEFSIMAGATELMNSRLAGSEEALATLGCAGLLAAQAPAVLIGGLGMGFTLRAALRLLPGDARVTVAEIVPAVVRWAQGPMAGLFSGSLADPRVDIVEDDVASLLREASERFDAALLDVDNGPAGLTRPENDALYSASGLSSARRALRQNGRVAVWSSGPDVAFRRRLGGAGFAVEEHSVRARGNKGARHTIWIARRS